MVVFFSLVKSLKMCYTYIATQGGDKVGRKISQSTKDQKRAFD